MKKCFILLLILILISSGCNLFDPISKAKSFTRKGEYEKAIKVLENEHKKNPKSVPVKSILAQTYSEFGLAICQNSVKPPKIKYNQAKEQFEKALALNPYLTDAKDMLEMIEKIQAHLDRSMIN